VLFSIGCGGFVAVFTVHSQAYLRRTFLDHSQGSRHELVPLAGLLCDQPHVLAATLAVLFSFSQVVDDSLANYIPRQRLASTPFLWLQFVCLLAARSIVEIVVVISGFIFDRARLPSRLEQRQLLLGKPFAFAVALRVQQFPQQRLVLVLFSEGAIQLRDQIEHDLLQRLGVLRQAVGIDRHVPSA